MKPYIIKTCLICKKEFATYNSAKNICPGECRKIASRLHTKEYMRKKRAEEKIIIKKICVICHQEFNCYKHIPDSTCFGCQVAKSKEPTRVYDITKKDEEGIIYGL